MFCNKKKTMRIVRDIYVKCAVIVFIIYEIIYDIYIYIRLDTLLGIFYIMFHKSFELCDVVSLCLLSEEAGQILMTAVPRASDSFNLRRAADNLYRFPCLKVVNEEWTKTAVDLAISLVGKAIHVSLLKLIKVWVPFNVRKYIHHVIFLVTVRTDDKMKTRGNGYKVRGSVLKKKTD